MAPRNREFDSAAVLERAMDVFWDKGYDAAGMSELVDRMGIGRQSIYNAFGEKRSLYLAALEHYAETRHGEALKLLRGAGSPLGRVRKLIRTWQEAASSTECRGCFFVNGAAGLHAMDDDVAAVLGRHQRTLEDALREVLIEAKRDGEKADFETTPRATARTLLALGYGMLVLGKTSPPKATIQDIADSALRLIEA